MARVALLTRPLPVHDGVAERLQAAGMASISLPTLQVRAHIDATESQLLAQHYDGVVCVSQHAVHFAFERLNALHIELKPTWFAAVGQASGQAIAQHWPDARLITPSLNDTQDTDGLWRALNQAQLIVPVQNVLIVRATVGRDVLRDRLVAAHMPVAIWACYQREPLHWDATQRAQLLDALRQNGLVIAITSVEGLRALMHNLPEHHTELLRQPVVTLHPAIATVAREYGFSQVKCVLPHEISQALLAQQL